MTFEQAVAFIFDVEGEQSNLSGDPGGLTKWGITSKQYPQVSRDDFSKDMALAIYRDDYWNRLHCGELPHGLDLLVFDAAVNQGPVQAARMLQDLLKIPQDGVVGAITIQAAQRFPDVATEYLAKRMYQYALVPQILAFGRGWFRRLAKAAQLVFQEKAS